MNNVLYMYLQEKSKIVLQKYLENKKYNSWFQQSRDESSPIPINTTYYDVGLLNRVKRKIRICDTIDPKTVNNITCVINVLLMVLTC